MPNFMSRIALDVRHLARTEIYMFFSVDLRLFRTFAANCFLRVTLGGSNALRRRASEMMPSCCTLRVNRRSIASKLSPSRFLTSTN